MEHAFSCQILHNSAGPDNAPDPFTLISKQGTAILQDHELAQMPVDIIAAQVCHHLHPEVMFYKEQAWHVLRN